MQQQEQIYNEQWYEAVRQTIGPHSYHLSEAEVSQLMQEMLSEMSPEEAERFFKKVGAFLRKGARFVGKALPKVAPTAGKVIGTFLGGPIGGKLGHNLGKAVGNIAKHVSPPSAPSAPKPYHTRLLAQTLMKLLNNQQFLNSLRNRILGIQTAQQVYRGNETVEVPFGAFMETLSFLAKEAAIEARQEGWVGESQYLYDAEGNLIVNPNSREEKATLLMEYLEAGEQAVPASHQHENIVDPMTEWFVESGMIHE